MTRDEIKAARLKLNMTQKQAAALSGVSLHAYLNAEMGYPVAPKVRTQVAAAMQTGQQQPIYRGQGFAALDANKRKELARMGGKASHGANTAHQFTRTEASAAGKLGGLSVSQDREHMRNIGRKGGLVRKAVLPAILLMIASCADKPNLRAELVGPPKQDGCRGDRACENYWCPGHPCRE